MKDEEMAEEYANKAHTHNILNWEKLKQAFLAGLKAGRPQWHKVKDELPTNTGLYLIFYYNSFFNDKVRCIARYSPDRKEFLNLNIGDGDEVIAWCEIPTFDKE